MFTLFAVAIGVYIGWKVPQPTWAFTLEDIIKQRIDTFRNK